MQIKKGHIDLVVIGTSAGGIKVLQEIFANLPADFPTPIVVVQHLAQTRSDLLIGVIQSKSKLRLQQAEEKEAMQPGTIYLAPPDYHLMIEKNGTFSFSDEEKINFARPSIDVLFETAADAFGSGVVGIVLTGANSDGANGLKIIKNLGGTTIVQDPNTAEASSMPLAALATNAVDYNVPANEISSLLLELVNP